MNHLRNKLTELCNRFHVDAMYAFGSRAQEVKKCLEEDLGLDEASRSDLDIGVKAPAHVTLPLDVKVAITQELEDLFGVSRVDLVDLKQADPFLALDIIKGEILYSRDDDVQAEHELFVLRRAGDLAYFARDRWNRILELK